MHAASLLTAAGNDAVPSPSSGRSLSNLSGSSPSEPSLSRPLSIGLILDSPIARPLPWVCRRIRGRRAQRASGGNDDGINDSVESLDIDALQASAHALLDNELKFRAIFAASSSPPPRLLILHTDDDNITPVDGAYELFAWSRALDSLEAAKAVAEQERDCASDAARSLQRLRVFQMGSHNGIFTWNRDAYLNELLYFVGPPTDGDPAGAPGSPGGQCAVS